MIFSPKLKCEYEDHLSEDFKGFCIDKNCQDQRTVCFICMKNQKHNSHPSQVLNPIQLENYFKENQQFLFQIEITLGKLNKYCQMLQGFLSSNNMGQNLNCLTTNEINNLIARFNINIRQNSFIRQLSVFENKGIYNQISNTLIRENNNASQFQFSQLNKHQKIEISDNKTIAKAKLCKGIVICEPSIGNITIFGFKIQELGLNGEITIGVCKKLSPNFAPDLNLNQHGCYMINNRGICYVHNDSQFNNIKSNFKFKEKDEIIIQIDHVNKKIVFTIQDSSLKFILQLKQDEDMEKLHPCVGFYGWLASSVEIMNRV